MRIRSKSKKRIVVVGGGVIGLTTALILSPEYNVTIHAEKIGVQSDSWKATAIWHVYLVPETEEILGWAQHALKIFCNLANKDKSAGVELIKGVELFRNSQPSIPSWSHIPSLFQMLSENEIKSYNNYSNLELSQKNISVLKKNPIIWGYHIEAPVANMQIYLPWLENRVRKNNVKIIEEKIETLNELSNSYDLIINCTGFEARELVNDSDFEVYKGQYFVLKGGHSSPKVYIGDDDHSGGMSYMIPRSGEVLIGGCAEKNIENLNLTLNLEDTIKRAGLYVPWLRKKSLIQQIREPVVGIRPCRISGIRLELDKEFTVIPVIHNYGHGGSGFSLSWGCAERVRSLIKYM